MSDMRLATSLRKTATTPPMITHGTHNSHAFQNPSANFGIKFMVAR
jgi:hypothetical protein